MTEGRRFKIEEIKKYESKVSGSSDRMLSSYLLISGAILLHNSSELGYPANLIYILVYIIHTMNWVDAFRDKKKYVKKIEELKEEFGPLYEQYLEEYEQEENRGRGR